MVSASVLFLSSVLSPFDIAACQNKFKSANNAYFFLSDFLLVLVWLSRKSLSKFQKFSLDIATNTYTHTLAGIYVCCWSYGSCVCVCAGIRRRTYCITHNNKQIYMYNAMCISSPPWQRGVSRKKNCWIRELQREQVEFDAIAITHIYWMSINHRSILLLRAAAESKYKKKNTNPKTHRIWHSNVRWWFRSMPYVYLLMPYISCNVMRFKVDLKWFPFHRCNTYRVPTHLSIATANLIVRTQTFRKCIAQIGSGWYIAAAARPAREIHSAALN